MSNKATKTRTCGAWGGVFFGVVVCVVLYILEEIGNLSMITIPLAFIAAVVLLVYIIRDYRKDGG